MTSRLTDAGVDRSRLRLILNQTPKHPEISPMEVSPMIGLPVCAVLPECRAELAETYTNGNLLNPKSNLRRQIGQLAERVAGLAARKSA